MLNFPSYNIRTKNTQKNTLVFDRWRKKWVVLTPEEWVRQHCLYFLSESCGIPAAWIAVEKEIHVQQNPKRFDIAVFAPDTRLWLLVECKAPQAVLNQEVLDQINRYNTQLNCPYLMLTNGMQHIFCQCSGSEIQFLEQLPKYPTVL